MRLPNYSEKKANRALELYKSGLTKKTVAVIVKLKINQVDTIIKKSGYKKNGTRNIKRPEKATDKFDYGCTVCCSDKKGGGYGYCSKHYYRYIIKPARIRKIKGI